MERERERERESEREREGERSAELRHHSCGFIEAAKSSFCEEFEKPQ